MGIEGGKKGKKWRGGRVKGREGREDRDGIERREVYGVEEE